MKSILLTLLCFSSASYASIPMSITFDDLPRHGDIPKSTTRLKVAQKILGILKKHKVPEVYGFINAKKLESDPTLVEVLKEWKIAGYPLGNHTFSHPNLNETSIEDYEKNIKINESILKKFDSSGAWKYFRYPFLKEGDTLEKRNAIREFLFKNGYKVAQVTVDFEDWSWNDPYARCKDKNDSQKIAWLKKTYMEGAISQLERTEAFSRKLFNREFPQILLLHIGAFDAEMLDELLTTYEKNKVKFVPLTETLKDPGYSIDSNYVSPAGAEWTYQLLRQRGIKEKEVGVSPYLNFQKDLEKTCR